MKKSARLVSIIVMSFMMLGITVFGKIIEDAILYPAKYNTTKGSYYGYINSEGKWVVEPTYEYVFPFSDGYGVVSDGQSTGVVDGKGKMVIPLSYQSISPYKEERAIFVNDKGMGVFDTKGKIVTTQYYNYIQDYSEGLAVIGTQVGDKSVYGYIDKDGKETIAPKYRSATDFKDGKALVQGEDGKYALINKKGETVATYDYPTVYGYSDGLLIYQDKASNKFGYIDETGKIVVPAKYESAESFKDGLAVVSTSPYLIGEKGVIDKNGAEIYATLYNDVLNLGEGRVALGKAIDVKEPLKGSIYAIADNKGEALTDFIYYGVSEYKDGMASAFDKTETYFINLKGKPTKGLPKIFGSGTLAKVGKVIRADIDYVTFYLGESGNIIYMPNGTIALEGDKKVMSDIYKPTLNYVVYFPQLNGLEDKAVETRINDKLKMQAMHDDVTAQEALEYTYYSDYTIPFYKQNLLVTSIQQSTYYFGAAHPLPGRIMNMIDLRTGQFYELKDLFKPESNWKEELNAILEKMSKEEPIASQLYGDQEKVVVEDEQGFYVDEENLYLYYPPYDVGPYASGYITFKIPYTEIMNSINQEGDFWKSYQQ